MTCCFPPFLLGCFGKKDKTAQYAFREKIGLVSIIFYIMAGVGFLTFGFTQTVCSTPPLSFKIDELDHGHIIIHGQAYPFTSWHHPSPFNQPMVDIIGSNGGGKGSGVKDASFLFQNINQRCMNIITSKKDHVPIGSQEFPTYFPCHLFDNTNQPDPSTYQNQTGCHVTTYARLELDRLKNNGIPNAKNRLDKVGRVYYDWSDINSTNHLTVFNSNVLNLKLLFSLPLNLFNIPANGLIETAIKNPSFFGGKDISRVVVSRSHLATTTTTNNNNNNNSNINWLQEAYCLLDIIKVGEIDTKSVGCIASDIVLYTSLLVILGTIFVKFILAILFGWCLSWKLGHFKEGRSYKERMKREKEIENWTTSINQPADMIRPRVYSPKPKPPLFLSSKINLMPKTSRFTPPETGSKHYKPAGSVQFERPGSSPLWKHSSSVHTLGQFNSSLSQLTDLGRCTPAFSEMASLKRFSEMTMPNSKRSSLSSHTNFTTTGLSSSASTMQCPYSLHPFAVHQPLPDFMPFGFPLIHTICLVTCYSEGEEGLRTTLDSIATTDYPNSHKLILVIADGDIVGHGNSKSTPDICISMMEDLLVPKHQVQPHSYVAIADGKKRHNMARIYAGFYHYDRRTVDRSQRKRVPMITIVKCGTPEERQQEKKPGNRGKRDSQVILMSFLQKVMFDERMTRLEYELFTNIWRVAGICPDAYEIVLMVDADTKIYPDSLSRMVSCMASDDQIAGLCGETKIGNKTDSWVSMIQVFEYYISHHQSKAFESIFGNVTCLPGCFCMYRIKAPKGNNGHWVPILANPDVIEHYSENVVDTLHKKNLLLLGEDRYLSTLMLKTFPHRKMLFVPQAVCKTVVPDTFSVLLSQRRRWINSTIHNLMELLFVNDLCGTFCFSMQFVVFMELVGTLTLPAAISFTIYLIILALLGQPALASLLLLALILGLPAILIVMTSRKLVYVIWMLIYLISLPIWNFVLPTYAYWHFDDFTWGETRKVQGEDDIKKESSNQHGEKDGVFDSSKIIMKKWCDYEKDRRLLEI
ncbi:chitin synthase-domain-containing protein [Cunninghamella echinulata]|nr:chitin synthase-domain-containing protein [Cunninghamella echinulata]